MRRKAWFRFVASMLAVWFPLVVGEPSLLQPCPMHSAAAVAQSSAHAMHGAASAHTGHQGANVSATAPDGGGTHNHQMCSCIANCCGAGSLTTAVAPRAPELVVVTTVAAHGACPTADALPRP